MSLKGKVVAVVRPQEQSKDLAEAVERLGGTPYLAPLIEVKPPSDPEALHRMIRKIAAGKVDVVVFMSRNGVLQTLKAAEQIGLLEKFRKMLERTASISVGPKTKHVMEEHGLGNPVVPDEYSSSGVVRLLMERGLRGKTVAIPRAQVASDELLVSLERLGAKVIEATAYEVKESSDMRRVKRFVRDLEAGKIDVVAFTSPSTVRSLMSNVRRLRLEKEIANRLRRVVVASIGPTTKKTLEDLGFQVDVMPSEYTVEALAREIAAYFQKNNGSIGIEDLDDLDRMILQALQDDFPLTVRPWNHLAARLGLDSQTLILRVRRMMKLGLIRKIGAFPNLRQIGFRASTLIGLRVPEERLHDVAEMINRFKSVSHNYLREHRYNLWFTVTAKDKREIDEILKLLRKTGLQDQDILNLPTVKTFKTDVRFTLQ
ncbi:uroporphyrinogen-III synthase [Candidatus Bathyarchaeota archaeon]|nr:uroporphyrinogen-III synthase [Candidatus Bathyarchaeota archaeon]